MDAISLLSIMDIVLILTGVNQWIYSVQKKCRFTKNKNRWKYSFFQTSKVKTPVNIQRKPLSSCHMAVKGASAGFLRWPYNNWVEKPV